MTAAFALALALAPASADAAPTQRKACFTSYEQVQVAMKRSRLLEAREAASACLSDTCPSALRSDCGQWLKEIEARLPSIVVEARTTSGKPVAGARVMLDGLDWKDRRDGLVSEVDPGDHIVRVERADAPPTEVHVVVAEGKKAQRVVVEVPDKAADEPKTEDDPNRTPVPLKDVPPPTARERAPVPVSVFVFAGISVLALGGFSFFAVTGKNAEHGLETCSPHCSDDQVSPVRQRYIAADIFLGVSVVALGIAAYSLFTRGDAGPRQSARTSLSW
jgi:hypothetical protein